MCEIKRFQSPQLNYLYNRKVKEIIDNEKENAFNNFPFFQFANIVQAYCSKHYD